MTIWSSEDEGLKVDNYPIELRAKNIGIKGIIAE